MLNQPIFKPDFHVEIVEPEGVFLLSEKESFLLSGRVYQWLVPLIDGDRTVDELIEHLQEDVSPTEVYYALMQMEQKGYIVDNDNTLPSILAEFCHILNVAPQQAVSRLEANTVSVLSFGAVPCDSLIYLLEELHIRVAEEGNVAVVLTDDYLQNNLEVFNREALQSKRPWLLVKPVGTVIWIGPIFHPEKTGCWECLAQRLRANRPVESFIQKRKGISNPFPTSRLMFPAQWQTAIALVAHEIAKWIISGEHEKLEKTLITLDTISLEMQHHIWVKRPQCNACGNKIQITNESIQEPSAIKKNLPSLVLNSCKKTLTADGGHRCFNPEETFEKYKYHISPITGVVRGLKHLSLGDKGLIHNYIASHNFSIDNLYYLRQNIRGRSGGKGKTDSQAKVSAFCEAIERYSGIFKGDEIRFKNSYQKLEKLAIHPNECMKFSVEQYKNRDKWNATCAVNLRVPEPFDESREIDWTPVWSLTSQKYKFLPTGYCYYGYPHPHKPECWADSNGCAAGNTLEEAILQGFMELVERDSVASWWYNRIKRPAVNLESFESSYFQALQTYYQKIDRELWILDITSDFNIPTFAAISRKINREIEDIIFGFGTHFDPKIAMTRALTELNQSLPAVLSVSITDDTTQYPSCQREEIDWWKTAIVKNQPYLVPDAKQTAKVYSDYPQHWRDDILDDVMICVEIAKQRGMEMLLLDLTRPDIGLNVVKVIIPGMRHFWKRLAPGRLYEIPVQLGWLPAPLSEQEMNPFPLSF